MTRLCQRISLTCVISRPCQSDVIKGPFRSHTTDKQTDWSIASGMHLAFSYQNVSSKTTHVTRRATLGFQTQPVAIPMSPHAFVVGSAGAARPRRPSPMPVPTSCGSVFLSSPLGLKNQRSHKKGAMKGEREGRVRHRCSVASLARTKKRDERSVLWSDGAGESRIVNSCKDRIGKFGTSI